MNERNANMLAHLIVEEFRKWNAEDYHFIDGRSASRLADFLASRGVLVPSAMTDDECIDVIEDAASPHEVREKKIPWVREGLGKIAKGER